MENYFTELLSINVNDKVEQKNGLTYLAWAFAWAEVKKRHPDAFYTIYENADGLFYHHDGHTCWVKTGVTVNGIEHIEYLPIMDFKNRSIPLDTVTSFDVNKAIQRSLTKAVARHGLGLYIYAGEDLPEGEQKQPNVYGADADELVRQDLINSIYKIAEENGVSKEGCDAWAMEQRGKPVPELNRADLIGMKKLFEAKTKKRDAK